MPPRRQVAPSPRSPRPRRTPAAGRCPRQPTCCAPAGTVTDPPDAESVAPVQRSVSSNRQLAVRGSAAGTSRNSTRTVHGAPGMQAVSGRTSIPATAPAAGGAGGMTGRPSGSGTADAADPDRPASRSRWTSAAMSSRRRTTSSATTATSTATDSSHAQTRVRAARPGPADGGFPERSSDTLSGRTAPPGLAVPVLAVSARTSAPSSARTAAPVERGARLLQPLPDRRHTGHGQLRHCAVELVDEPGVHRVPRADLSADCGGELAEQGGITPARPTPAAPATRPSTSTVIRSTAGPPSSGSPCSRA